jgi:hypothetical protein
MKRTVVNVLYSDGRQESYPVTPKVELTFEKAHRLPVHPKTFEGANGTSLVYSLAWEAMRASKKNEVVKAMDGWVDDLEATEVASEDVRPFAAAGSDTSSTSPLTPE